MTIRIGGLRQENNRIDELVGVGCEDERARIRQAQQGRDPDPDLGDDPAEDRVPLVVHQAGGVLPGLHVGIEGHVGPGMVAMSREVEPSLVGIEKTPKEPLVAHISSKRNRIVRSRSTGRAGSNDRGIMKVESWNRSTKTRFRSAERVR